MPAGRRFLLALIGATAIPYLLFPLSTGLLAGLEGIDVSRRSLIFLGSSGHVAASFFFYGDGDVRSRLIARNPARFWIAPLLVIAATSAFFARAGWLLPYGICLYWVWQTHHYTRQNHGILAFASRAASAPVSEAERTALILSGVAGVIGMTTFVTPYRETVLAGYGWHLHHVALGVYAAAWLFYLRALVERPESRRGLRAVMLAVLMLFYLPLFLFDDPLSAVTTYAIAHGLQYLVFMGHVARVPPQRRRLRIAGLLGCIAAGGFLLEFLQRPDPFGAWRMPVYGAYLGIVMWHFLLDAGVWRLSEPFQRAYMAERFGFLRPAAATATSTAASHEGRR